MSANVVLLNLLDEHTIRVITSTMLEHVCSYCIQNFLYIISSFKIKIVQNLYLTFTKSYIKRHCCEKRKYILTFHLHIKQIPIQTWQMQTKLKAHIRTLTGSSSLLNKCYPLLHIAPEQPSIHLHCNRHVMLS